MLYSYTICCQLAAVAQWRACLTNNHKVDGSSHLIALCLHSFFFFESTPLNILIEKCIFLYIKTCSYNYYRFSMATLAVVMFLYGVSCHISLLHSRNLTRTVMIPI